jgi:hypothetical protein
VVFELSPAAGGTWTETVLHNFAYNVGTTPHAGLIFDGAGNLYGTTTKGGAFDGGTAFELTAKDGGGWANTVLINFDVPRGFSPTAGLAFDGVGNLYGETGFGGPNREGTVFELEPKEGGGWADEILHSFDTGSGGGEYPAGGLTFDGKGDFYGTAGGGADGDGELFEFTPIAGGGWEHRCCTTLAMGWTGRIRTAAWLWMLPAMSMAQRTGAALTGTGRCLRSFLKA